MTKDTLEKAKELERELFYYNRLLHYNNDSDLYRIEFGQYTPIGIGYEDFTLNAKLQSKLKEFLNKELESLIEEIKNELDML